MIIIILNFRKKQDTKYRIITTTLNKGLGEKTKRILAVTFQLHLGYRNIIHSSNFMVFSTIVSFINKLYIYACVYILCVHTHTCMCACMCMYDKQMYTLNLVLQKRGTEN